MNLDILEIHLKNGRIIGYPFYFKSKFAVEYYRSLKNWYGRDNISYIEIRPWSNKNKTSIK